MEHEGVAVVGLVVDLAAADAERLPAPPSRQAVIEGIALARLAVAAGQSPLPLVTAALATMEHGTEPRDMAKT
jgi:hypothetical protein